MNDPHVVALVYQLDHCDSIDYSKASPIHRDGDRFHLSILDGIVRFDLHDHFSTIEAADKALLEFRQAWEFDAQLTLGLDTFRLVLDRNASEIVDRNPTPNYMSISGYDTIEVSMSASLCIGVPTYPVPPMNVTLTPDVKMMFNRYIDYKKGCEPLASMANFCLTVLEHSTGQLRNRRCAASVMYGIDKMVLNKIGCLSANCGGSKARKAVGIERDFTSEEMNFLVRAVIVLIRRMAERAHASNNKFPQISLSDLLSL